MLDGPDPRLDYPLLTPADDGQLVRVEETMGEALDRLRARAYGREHLAPELPWAYYTDPEG